MKRKERVSNPSTGSSWHPFVRRRHLICSMQILAAALSLDLPGAAARAMPRPGIPTRAAGDERRKKDSHAADFVLFGTVFTEQGLALHGAEIRVHPAGRKKPHWEARSDRRGEFAVRVPRGADYELNVTANGFRGETRQISASNDNRRDMVFRLPSAAGGKSK